jgi:hypothetical protein
MSTTLGHYPCLIGPSHSLDTSLTTVNHCSHVYYISSSTLLHTYLLVTPTLDSHTLGSPMVPDPANPTLAYWPTIKWQYLCSVCHSPALGWQTHHHHQSDNDLPLSSLYLLPLSGPNTYHQVANHPPSSNKSPALKNHKYLPLSNGARVGAPRHIHLPLSNQSTYLPSSMGARVWCSRGIHLP